MNIAETGIPELAKTLERKIIMILLLSEEILHRADPQTENAESALSDLADFVTITEKAYDRLKSSLNEMQG